MEDILDDCHSKGGDDEDSSYTSGAYMGGRSFIFSIHCDFFGVQNDFYSHFLLRLSSHSFIINMTV